MSNPFAECHLAHKYQARLAILRHAGELRGRLPRIQRHDDHSFGHERQMENGPANRIWREKSATVSGLNRRASNERANQLALVQQFPAAHAYEAITANFAKNDAAIRALQLAENRFEKIRHEESANCRKRRRCRVVTLGELNQILAQR